MQLKKISLLLLVGSSFLQTLNGYVYEYKQLCHSKTGTIVDLFYDIHVAVPNYSVEQFMQLDYATGVSKLYPTEQRMLSLLHELNSKGNPCDLIWETPTSERYTIIPYTPCFISLDSFFKLHELQNIRFIAADKHRNCGFNSLFSVKEGEKFRPGYNLTGCTFENPAPLSATTIEAIKRISGNGAWQQYAAFRGTALEKLKNYFSAAYHNNYTIDYKKDVSENAVFNSLCDIEMLSYILASDAPRIIIYAGGWHCTNIAQFLENNADFKVVRHEPNTFQYKELAAHLLAPSEAKKGILSAPFPSLPSLSSLSSVLPTLPSFLLKSSQDFWEYIFKKTSTVSPSKENSIMGTAMKRTKNSDDSMEKIMSEIIEQKSIYKAFCPVLNAPPY